MAVKTKKQEETVIKTDNKRGYVKELLENIDSNWFSLSLELNSIYQGKEFEEWNYESFRDYIELELQLEYRIAMYRVKISQAITDYNIDKEEVLEIGWTKFKELIPFLTKDKRKRAKLFKLAKELTVRELQAKLREAKGGGKEQSISYSFKFNPEQSEIINEALEIGAGVFKTQDKNRVLEAIVSEWLSSR